MLTRNYSVFVCFKKNNEVPLASPVQMKIHLSARVQRPHGAGEGEVGDQVDEEAHPIGDPWSPLASPVPKIIHLSARVQRPRGAGAGEVEEEDHFVGDPWSPFPLRDVVSSSWELRPRLQSVTQGIFQEYPWAVASSSL